MGHLISETLASDSTGCGLRFHHKILHNILRGDFRARLQDTMCFL